MKQKLGFTMRTRPQRTLVAVPARLAEEQQSAAVFAIPPVTAATPAALSAVEQGLLVLVRKYFQKHFREHFKKQLQDQGSAPRTQRLMTVTATAWQWLLAKRKAQVDGKRLRVIETVALGEKRFVAVLHVDGAQFLIGGGANNVSLLATLDATSHSPFAHVLQTQAAQSQAVQSREQIL